MGSCPSHFCFTIGKLFRSYVLGLAQWCNGWVCTLCSSGPGCVGSDLTCGPIHHAAHQDMLWWLPAYKIEEDGTDVSPGLIFLTKRKENKECRESIFHMGNLFPAFRETKEGQSALLVLAASQVTLIQNNQYAIVEYFRAACHEPQ